MTDTRNSLVNPLLLELRPSVRLLTCEDSRCYIIPNIEHVSLTPIEHSEIIEILENGTAEGRREAIAQLEQATDPDIRAKIVAVLDLVDR